MVQTKISRQKYSFIEQSLIWLKRRWTPKIFFKKKVAAQRRMIKMATIQRLSYYYYFSYCCAAVSGSPSLVWLLQSSGSRRRLFRHKKFIHISVKLVHCARSRDPHNSLYAQNAAIGGCGGGRHKTNAAAASANIACDCCHVR